METITNSNEVHPQVRPCSGVATDPDGSAQCPSPRCHAEFLR